MATIRVGKKWEKIPYLVSKRTGYHWQPSKRMRVLGFDPVALGKDLGGAVSRSRELNETWQAFRKDEGPQGPDRGTLEWLVAEYEDSDWYKDLRDKTRLEYDWAIRQIKASPMARHPVASIKRPTVRKLHKIFSDAKSRSQANKVIKVLRRLLSYAIEMELIESNPAMKLGLKHNQGRKQTWQPEQVQAFIDKAMEMERGAWGLAVSIGYGSSQRLSDILGAHPRQFDGEGMDWTQSKTGEEVWTPLNGDTIALMRDLPRESISNIIAGANGQPISLYHFNRVFNRIRSAAGLPDTLQFMDLRRTAASEVLAGGGRAEPLTGHRPGSSVIRRYERPSKTAARTAQKARERGKKGTKVGNGVGNKVGKDFI
jgi:hypothetical protein